MKDSEPLTVYLVVQYTNNRKLYTVISAHATRRKALEAYTMVNEFLKNLGVIALEVEF